MVARSLAPALTAGNAAVIKSAELDPLSAFVYAELAEEVGLPDGAVNILCGYGKDAGAALAAHPDIDQIVFTGSIPTGRSILRAAAESVVPCVMELGGKSPGIVFADADLDVVLADAQSGIFMNSGQVCDAMSRLVVHGDVHDVVVERFAARTNALSIGRGLDDCDITPLISAGQLDRVEAYALSGTKEGARAVTGGRRALRRARRKRFPHPYAVGISAAGIPRNDGTLLGTTTSGGYGHSLDKRLALAYLDIAEPVAGFTCDVNILGESCRARVLVSSSRADESLSALSVG